MPYCGLPEIVPTVLLPTVLQQPGATPPMPTPGAGSPMPSPGIAINVGLPSGAGTAANPIPIPGITVRPASAVPWVPIAIGGAVVLAFLMGRD